MQPMIRSALPSQPRAFNTTKSLPPSVAIVVVGVGVLLSMFLMVYRFPNYVGTAMLPLVIAGVVAITAGHIVLTARIIGVFGFISGVLSCMIWSLSMGIMTIGLAFLIQMVVQLIQNLNQNAKKLEVLQHDIQNLTAALGATQAPIKEQPVVAQPTDAQGAIFNFQPRANNTQG